MGCARSKRAPESVVLVPRAGSYAAEEGSSGSKALPLPADDVVTDVFGLCDGSFAVGGSDGWVHIYGTDPVRLEGRFRGHRKAVNRLCEHRGLILTASGDGSVRLWDRDACAAAAPWEPRVALDGHDLAVSGLELLAGSGSESSRQLMTGSRDCSVCLWDLETAKRIQRSKILRNVVTSIRRVHTEPHLAVQASEDLMLRLWDVRTGPQPVAQAAAGPDQVICLDVADDGHFVLGGTKGFSRESCQVRAFDLRASLRPLSSLACADQSIEALHFAQPEQCIVAAKDGVIRLLATSPELKVLSEHGRELDGGYTALGLQRRPEWGPLTLAAAVGPRGIDLELLEWQRRLESEAPRLLAGSC